MPATSSRPFEIRDFRPSDSDGVNAVALQAFSDFKNDIGDWPTMANGVGSMSSLAGSAEIIVATVADQIAGAVAYVASGVEKQEWFDREWPVIRLLVVDPVHRGIGLGRALTEECISRARRDHAPLIALHTSPIMRVALQMYERMGFTLLRPAPIRHGIPYGIYVKELT